MSLINRSLGAIGAFLRAGPDTSLVASDPQGSTSSPFSGKSASEEIPVLHRLAIIYLMLPVVIWLVGWHQWWLGVPAAVLLAIAFWQSIGPGRDSFSWEALSQAWRAVFLPTTVVVLLGAFAWVMTTAAGGVFDVRNADWIKHHALFLDLARGSWPVYHPYWLSELSVFFPEGVELSGFTAAVLPGLLHGAWIGGQVVWN